MFDPNVKINRSQKTFTAPQYRQLVKNHQERPGADKAVPVVKLFDPFGAGTWLLTELDPETGMAYGLCDLGMGSPEFGYLYLPEVIAVGRIERDLHFKSTKTLTEWMQHAQSKGSLVGV